MITPLVLLHLTRVRESKLENGAAADIPAMSHPARVRESKSHWTKSARRWPHVAPHAGARIEIWWQMRFALMSRRCRTLRGCANRNTCRQKTIKSPVGLTLRGCANRNKMLLTCAIVHACRTLHGCANRNPTAHIEKAYGSVAPCTGARIKTERMFADCRKQGVAPCTGA